MPIAGTSTKVYVTATNVAAVSSDEIAGIRQGSYAPKRNMLDVSAFKDADAFMRRIAGLKDFSIPLSGDYEAGDAPQSLLRSSWDSGATAYVTLLWNGTAGVRLPVLIESFEISSSRDGKVEFTASCQCNGPVVTV